jgi:hypothetical protein
MPVLVAIVAAVCMLGQSAAYAAGTATYYINGSGTISPGLTTVPTPQMFTFTTANAAGLPSFAVGGSTNGGAIIVTVNCLFTGSSTLPGGETSAAGLGAGSGSCSTSASIFGTHSITCSLTYVRAGSNVDIAVACTGNVNGNPNNSGSGGGTFHFVPTSVNPTTSYQLSGTATVTWTNA